MGRGSGRAWVLLWVVVGSVIKNEVAEIEDQFLSCLLGSELHVNYFN